MPFWRDERGGGAGAAGRNHAPRGLGTHLPRVPGLLFRRDVVKGRLRGETLGTRRGQEGGVATDKGERLPRHHTAIPECDGELHRIVGLERVLLRQMRGRPTVVRVRRTMA